MRRQQTLVLALLAVFLMLNASHVVGQTPPRLEITMIGLEPGTFVVPVGQTAELKFEILNGAPGDIYLVQGDASLDPNLSGNWVVVHSESLGDFHLGYLESAIWTLDFQMPAQIQAANQTNGLPQVALMIQVTYSTGSQLLQSQQQLFTLNVPGATVAQPNTLSWVAGIAAVIVLVATLIAIRAYRKNRK
jgi:hypothetical protein